MPRKPPKTTPRLVTAGLIRAALGIARLRVGLGDFTNPGTTLQHLALHRGVGLTPKQADSILAAFAKMERTWTANGGTITDAQMFCVSGWFAPSWLPLYPGVRVAALEA